MDKILMGVKNTIDKYNMIKVGDNVIVGVSGGADSICLLHVLNSIKAEYGFELHIAHVNHGLRGAESEKDSLYVKQAGDKLKIPVHILNGNVKDFATKNKMTTEEAGRTVRYDFFERLRKELGADKIAVGHNRNDNVETFFINLFRGSGLKGLSGIEPVFGKVIRPLIDCDRQDIEAYCGINKLNFCVDESNKDLIFTRNRIRQELIPYIRENINPNIINTVTRTMHLIKSDNDILQEETKRYFKKCMIEASNNSIIMSMTEFNSQSDTIKKRVLRLAIQELKGDVKAVEKVHLENAIAILAKNRAKLQVQIPKDILINTQRGRFVIFIDK